MRTEKDVKAIQKAAKLTQTGVMDEQTVRAAYTLVHDTVLRTHKNAYNKLTLLSAENGELKKEVARLQKELKDKGGTSK